MKTTYNGGQYDAILDGDDIELQSITESIIFPNGAKELREDAEKAFYSVRYAGQRLNGFVSDYIDDHLQYYVDIHKDEAVTLTHDLN